MGQLQTLNKVMVTYRLDPTPDIEGIPDGTANQFLQLYTDLKGRENSKQNPSSDIMKLFKTVHENIQCTVNRDDNKEVTIYDAMKQRYDSLK